MANSGNVTPPSISATEAVRLLLEQRERAKRLLASPGLPAQEYRNWRIATRQILVEALGDDHQMALMVASAGAPRRAITEDGEEIEIELEALRAGSAALEPCIEHLRRQALRDAEREAAGSYSEDQPFISYDTALICRNGHIVNDAMRFLPDDNKKHCPKCGAVTISACPNCTASIQGQRKDGSSTQGLYAPPGYCRECGEGFPWTAARLASLSQLLAMTAASVEDQVALRDSLPSIAADSPSTPVAIAQWRKFLAGAGKQMGELIRGVLVDVASEAVKKKLFP